MYLIEKVNVNNLTSTLPSNTWMGTAKDEIFVWSVTLVEYPTGAFLLYLRRKTGATSPGANGTLREKRRNYKRVSDSYEWRNWHVL